MNISQAHHVIRRFYRSRQPEEMEPVYEEACHCLIDGGDMDAADELGAYYIRKKDYTLAFKYYTMAAESGIAHAWLGLGYIWYYGYTGVPDYENAWLCFNATAKTLTGEDARDNSFWEGLQKGQAARNYFGVNVHLKTRADANDYINAVYKMADMYRMGHYVERDYKKYAYLIRSMQMLMIEVPGMPDFFLPEIDLRLADIIITEGSTDTAGQLPPEEMSPEEDTHPVTPHAPQETVDEALIVLDDARYRIAERLQRTRFYGDFRIMKSIVTRIYSLFPATDPLWTTASGRDFYDLYHILRTPCTVTFLHGDAFHTITAEREGEGMVVCCDGKWYDSIDKFMQEACLDGERIPDIYDQCRDFSLSETSETKGGYDKWGTN